ncbi:MAG: hypothetical protein ACYCZX_07815 [Rhodospirillaceae bacterium]
MRHSLRRLSALGIAAFIGLPFSAASAMAAETPRAVIPAEREEAARAVTPPQFRVLATELDGPVFANGQGKTLYFWPNVNMRNGVTGDVKNESACTFEKRMQTAGLMSPYPPGLELPELETRKACAEVWAPEYAADDARPVGDFTIFTRKDGKKQWAYDHQALYTSYLDQVPGDVMAASTRYGGGDAPAVRHVAVAPSLHPSGFNVISTELGRQVLTDKNFSIYAWDRDGPLKSNCEDLCTRTWEPVLAPAVAQASGDWSVFERSTGVYQWAYRKKPLYTYKLDSDQRSQDGSDIPGWHNVYTQKAPPPPQEFTFQDSIGGVVLADAKGKTLYTYNCADDSVDQLACDQVDSPQVYRLAICGGGEVERCLRDWPYVVASASAKSLSRSWQVIAINPQTGHLAKDGDQALRVWAYRGRPVYTNAADKAAGDIAGNGNGEFGGSRNGFKAFFVRTEFGR